MPGRCICGRSETFPVCDGGHQSESWSCDHIGGGTIVRGGRHLTSAALRLAHHLGARPVDPADPVPERAQRLVLLVDATDLPDLPTHLSRPTADHVEILAVDLPAAAVQTVAPEATVREVRCPNPLQLWRAVTAALADQPARPAELDSAFVSHAVADEPLLLPVVDRLRRHAGADLFLCADSLQPGDRWLDRILAELDAARRFLLVVSAASAGSTFCAFETGWARRAGTPIYTVSLDGTPPPAFVGDVQAVDLVRHRAARPWLTPDEALTDVLVDLLAT